MSLNQRQHTILQTLAAQGSVDIGELARTLGVSPMTIHRDLDQLARAGQVRKVRGGALPAEPREMDGVCLACYGALNPRSQVVLHMADGSQRRACCPHCGLMALSQGALAVASFLVTDFLYGRMVNGRTASYIAAPAITVCCTPTLLAFEDVEDAQRFQTGFGGRLLTLEEATAYLQAEMHL
jgi:DNA-binding IscR family transcriptional regulator